MKTLKHHPLANLLPMMSDPQYEALKSDIATAGRILEPVVLLDGKILDGRNRYRAGIELKIEIPTVDFKKSWGDPLQWVKSTSTHRNLDESQLACVAVNFADEFGRQNSDATPLSLDELAYRFAVNRDYVSKARTLKTEDAELFETVFDGREKIYVAHREWKRNQKTRALKSEARRIARDSDPDDRWEIIVGKCEELLHAPRTANLDAKLVFIDPPYNIGVDYGNGAKRDSLSRSDFILISVQWLDTLSRSLADDGSIFVMTSMEYLGAYEEILRGLGLHWRQTIIWVETFGNYTPCNFSPCCRPILYFTKSADSFTFHGDQILIPSDRQLKYADSRANPAGKVPSNVWTEFPRIVDNDAERVPGFPTQIPRKLVERIVLAASNPGDLVLDGFNGSGTTGVAALLNHRRYLGIEANPANAALARARITKALSEGEK